MADNQSAVERAEAYYDSADADEFYFQVWGGEDIHVGLYDAVGEPPIRVASRRTVERMANRLSHLAAGARVLDVGAGYGGSARYLAREKALHVTCLNLSKVQNNRNRAMNREAGLAERIDVVDGNFEALPFGPSEFDAVWSQDAILHSADRPRVLAQIDRVLRPGGDILFTDPMQADDADPAGLQPVLDRIHLDSLGSFGFYRRMADDLGWSVVEIEDLSENLPRHYASVRAELESREEELARYCGADYRERMKTGLQHWVDAGNQGALAWGILHFRKRI